MGLQFPAIKRSIPEHCRAISTAWRPLILPKSAICRHPGRALVFDGYCNVCSGWARFLARHEVQRSARVGRIPKGGRRQFLGSAGQFAKTVICEILSLSLFDRLHCEARDEFGFIAIGVIG